MYPFPAAVPTSPFKNILHIDLTEDDVTHACFGTSNGNFGFLFSNATQMCTITTGGGGGGGEGSFYVNSQISHIRSVASSNDRVCMFRRDGLCQIYGANGKVRDTFYTGRVHHVSELSRSNNLVYISEDQKKLTRDDNFANRVFAFKAPQDIYLHRADFWPGDESAENILVCSTNRQLMIFDSRSNKIESDLSGCGSLAFSCWNYDFVFSSGNHELYRCDARMPGRVEKKLSMENNRRRIDDILTLTNGNDMAMHLIKTRDNYLTHYQYSKDGIPAGVVRYLENGYRLLYLGPLARNKNGDSFAQSTVVVATAAPASVSSSASSASSASSSSSVPPLSRSSSASVF
jgi:hypothetical protein